MATPRARRSSPAPRDSAAAGSDAFHLRSEGGVARRCRGAAAGSQSGAREAPGDPQRRPQPLPLQTPRTARPPPWRFCGASCSCAESLVSGGGAVPAGPLARPAPGRSCRRPPGNNEAWGRGRARFGGAAARVAVRVEPHRLILPGWAREPRRWRGSGGGHTGAWVSGVGAALAERGSEPQDEGARRGWVGAARWVCARHCSGSILCGRCGLRGICSCPSLVGGRVVSVQG